jgi:hypothetical protein
MQGDNASQARKQVWSINETSVWELEEIESVKIETTCGPGGGGVEGVASA